MNITAVLVAGGMGKRLGKPQPKAFVNLAGKEIFRYAFETLDETALFDKIIIVVPKEAVESTKEKLSKLDYATSTEVIAGGAERWNSVENGVLEADGELVMIHDAARPFLTSKVITDLTQTIGKSAGVITATPVIDTVRTFEENRCGTTLDRSAMIAVGTPQLFNREILTECFQKAYTMDTIPTDEAMLLEKCNHQVYFTWGDRLNFKVTTPEDLEIAEAILAQRKRNEK